MKQILVLFIVICIFSCKQAGKKEKDSMQETNKVELAEVTIQVGGMHCDMCAASIEKGVSELQGVSFIKVNLADSTAVVRFDKKKVFPGDIEKAIEKRGYFIKEK